MLLVKVKLFSPKKTPQNSHFWRQGIWVAWLWEKLYAKLLGLGQLLGYPWKVWGITVQTSYWEGLWHQNCGYTSPILFFGGGKRNQWKMELFCKTLRTRKFSTGKFSGASTHGILTHSGFRICIWKVGTTNFGPCFGRPKLGECDKMGSVSKIMRR